MGLRDILDAIEADAHAEVAGIVQAATHGARTRVADAEAEAARIADAEAERHRVRARREAAVAVHAAELDAHRRVAESQEALYQELLDEVRRALGEERRGPNAGAVLAALVDEALGACGTPRRLRVRPGDDDAARRGAAGRGGDDLEVIGDLPGDALGGCVVEDGRGRRVSNTLASRLARADGTLRQRFLAELGEVVRGDR